MIDEAFGDNEYDNKQQFLKFLMDREKQIKDDPKQIECLTKVRNLIEYIQNGIENVSDNDKLVFFKQEEELHPAFIDYEDAEEQKEIIRSRFCRQINLE